MNIPDDEVNGELKGYVVSYVPVSIGGVKVIDGVAKTKSVGADTHSIDLDKVLSFTTYAIRVAGLTKRGEGKFCKVKYEGKYPKENRSSRSQGFLLTLKAVFTRSRARKW